jgi:hypothetical protein
VPSETGNHPRSLLIPEDNRSRSLAAPQIPLLGEELSQMSFGERAALEGVLGQCEPRLAVEIDTYKGRSLRFLARHCEQVHAFDLYDLRDASADALSAGVRPSR